MLNRADWFHFSWSCMVGDCCNTPSIAALNILVLVDHDARRSRSPRKMHSTAHCTSTPTRELARISNFEISARASSKFVFWILRTTYGIPPVCPSYSVFQYCIWYCTYRFSPIACLLHFRLQTSHSNYDGCLVVYPSALTSQTSKHQLVTFHVLQRQSSAQSLPRATTPARKYGFPSIEKHCHGVSFWIPGSLVSHASQ